MIHQMKPSAPPTLSGVMLLWLDREVVAVELVEKSLDAVMDNS
jgi:hypothetical protein